MVSMVNAQEQFKYENSILIYVIVGPLSTVEFPTSKSYPPLHIALPLHVYFHHQANVLKNIS